MDNPTSMALDVEGIKAAQFWSRDAKPWVGVVYDSVTGQEYDVRKVRFGWNVNDDLGRSHFGLTIAWAIGVARAANKEEES